MSYTERLKEILAEYDQAVQGLQQKRRLFDGVMGFGNHPGNAACHETLDRQVTELCREAAGEADAEDAAALAEAVLGAAGKWKGPEYARLMLVAVQRHAEELIGRLDPEKRQALALSYAKEYPRRKRLPVQEEVLAALCGEPFGKKK